MIAYHSIVFDFSGKSIREEKKQRKREREKMKRNGGAS